MGKGRIVALDVTTVLLLNIWKGEINLFLPLLDDVEGMIGGTVVDKNNFEIPECGLVYAGKSFIKWMCSIESRDENSEVER